MRTLKLILAALFLISPFAANADLILTINDAGAGQTAMTFSGSATYATGTGQAPNGIAWTGTGFASLFATGSPGSMSIDSGSFTASSSAGGSGPSTDNLDVWLSLTDSGFQPRFTNTRFTISDGAFVQWSGAVIANVDFSVFTPGTYATQSLLFGTLIDNDFLRVEVGQVAVPEPGTLALLGIGLLGMGAARRRKKV